jgi:surface protein
VSFNSLDTSQVTTFKGLFDGCEMIVEMDTSSWNTENVTTMEEMYRGMTNLWHLDLTNFNFDNVSTFSEMFKECVELACITNINTKGISGSSKTAMFDRCNVLGAPDSAEINTITSSNGQNWVNPVSCLPQTEPFSSGDYSWEVTNYLNSNATLTVYWAGDQVYSLQDPNADDILTVKGTDDNTYIRGGSVSAPSSDHRYEVGKV